jgi:hypothetical protein
MSLESEVNRKYIETRDASDWQIETDSGWEDLNSVSKTIAYEVWEIKTVTKTLKCADEHILFYEGFVEVFCKDIKVGEKIITVDGLEEVISIRSLGFENEMYDIDMNNSNKRFYTNGLLSHNSTIIGLYCLWKCIFSHKNKPIEIWILSDKGDHAKSFLEDIKDTYEQLDVYLKSGAGIIEYNKTSVEFENGCKIISSATSKSAIRGETPHVLVLDEFAHVMPHIADEFFTAVWPSISTGGQMIVISTPNGNKNKFHELFSNANNRGGDNGFNAFEMAWNEPPGRDEEFKRAQINATSLQEWNQEYEAKFLGSAKTLIDADVLESIQNMPSEALYKYVDFDVWEKPKSKHLYILSCDVAKGVEQDYSVMQILDVTDNKVAKQVGVWYSNVIDPFDFSSKVSEIGRLYNNAFVIVENNTYGHEVARRLFDDFEYENLYKEKKAKQWGIPCIKKTKDLGTTYLKRYIENKKLIIQDPGTYDELCDFIEHSPGVYKCSHGKHSHDDRVMALVWGVYFIETDYWKQWKSYMVIDENMNNKEMKGLEEKYEPLMCEEVYEDIFGDDDILDKDWLSG